MKHILCSLARCASATLAVGAFCALSACSSAPPLFLSDGRPTTLVQCREGSDSCSQQASAACGGPFDVVRQSSEGSTLNLIYACRAK
ncbi:MAG: FIG00453500: hypothetical protein [uncultured Paraburkholderia sp.]|nr:MAG: FIG00453500: hypothetical protein [uncultured Paraburkholderia sp.]CAH2913241.1 MAG: FIG00453500: hypothetical protein [uncultured Paraburkholderia sp.]